MSDETFMRRAIELAAQGEGCVEPNPMVGCVIVQDGRVIAEGWHEHFGNDHAEIVALKNARESVANATAYVSLEPCCHQGKTGPCTEALIEAKISRVVIAAVDPFPEVAGKGIARLQDAGIEVVSGVLESESKSLISPFAKLVLKKQPWVIAKWAMTLDGKIATAAGNSKWISNEQCRAIVHKLRGRVDAVMVGSGTAHADDPMLNARPAKGCDASRIATRIVVDTNATLSLSSKLVQSIDEAPVLLFCGLDAPQSQVAALKSAGCEIVQLNTRDVSEMLLELGRRKMTNVLIEGGSQLLGSMFAQDAVDEAHVFIGTQIAGGERITAVAGNGFATIEEAPRIKDPIIETIGDNVYVRGRVR